MESPDYAAIEGLIRQILDELRTLNVLVGGGEFGEPVRVALRDAFAAHAELTQRMNDDALDAHAAGHIFAQLLGERVEGLRDLANEMRGSGDPPHPQPDLMAAILRRYPSGIAAD
ncbi:MAG: hypothetical protein ABI881_04195 [Betaproteobacteria bacterium]